MYLSIRAYMIFRKFKPFESSGTVEFKDPDTGYVHKGKNLNELYVGIIRYRVQNELDPIENLNEVVENYLCGLPENCNKCHGVELHRSLYQYIKGGVALLKNMYFQKFAPQSVAEERGRQCVKCVHNVFPDKDMFMGWADDFAIMQVGENKVSMHNELASCEVCTCSLRSKVFFDGELDKFKEDEVAKMKAVNCWQLKLSKQE